MIKLSVYRQRIDSLDRQILEMISKRGRLAKTIGKIKNHRGTAVFDPEREKQIYDRLAHINQGPYNSIAITSIFREIISATRSLEAPLRVAYLGPEATFTHLAAVEYFGSSAELVPAAGIQAIFERVEKGECEYGVVPIENSTEGVVSHTLDMFVNSPLKVCAEVVLKVVHHLLSRQSKLENIKIVYSHSHAIAQCRHWLATHLSQAKVREVDSTAHAVKRAAAEKHAAAIGSEISSSVYQLPIVSRQIQDQIQNFTRFLVIGNQTPKKTGDDKTSILFIVRDEVGALYRVLGVMAKAQVNLSKIESRPLKQRAWSYMFFADLDGHSDLPRLASVLQKIKKHCRYFQLLGSYPKSRTSGY